MDPIKITREDLYEQVWTTPMSKLARQYGVSDVALAKTCRRLNVPRPGRGHWAKLAAGKRLKRPPLPAAGQGQPTWVFLRPVENPEPPAVRVVPPAVTVPENLRDAHGVVRTLARALNDADVDAYERLTIGTPRHGALAVTVHTHRRALLVLDALSKALVERGHGVTLQGIEDPKTATLAFVVSGEQVEASVFERLDSKEHVLTPEEQERADRGDRRGIRKSDHFATGRLQVVLRETSLGRGSWFDTERRPLERCLGHIIVAVEAAAEIRRLRRAEEERRRREEEVRQRQLEAEQERRRVEAARAKHRERLALDLRQMARNWRIAVEVRAFLDALEGSVAPSERDDTFRRWLEWAKEEVIALNPLAHARAIAKRLEPDVQAQQPSARVPR